MKNKLKDNLFLKIISISIAIIVWLYIQVVQSPVNDFYFYNIEVLDMDGNEITADILEDRDLYIVKGEKPTVDIHVRTSLLKLLNLKKDSYEARVDLSNAPNSKTYPVRIVKKGDNLNDIEISVRNAKQVEITFEKIEVKDNIPVKIELDTSKLPENYYTDLKYINLDKSYIKIRANESFAIEKIRAVIDIDLTGKTNSFSDEYPIRLVNSGNNRPISGDFQVELIDETVNAEVNIFYKKEVDVKLSKKDENTELQIEPDKVEIIGEKDKISNIQELTIRDYTLDSNEVGYSQKIAVPESDKYSSLQEFVTVKITDVKE